MRRWLLAALLLATVSAGCRGDTGSASQGSGPAPDATTETVTTEDGLRLDARLFAADPDRVVILLHMYQANQESWFETARTLRDRGISALTLDFRGYGASEGEVEPGDIDRDVRAALAFARARGYEHIVLAGASMGGTAAIVTAAGEEVDGVLTLSAPQRFRSLDADSAVKDVQAPLALIAARGDTSAEQAIESFEARTRADGRRTLLVEGRAHGTQLLTSPESQEVMQLLFEFLEDVWEPGS